MTLPRCVIDTNIALDLLVFDDPRTGALRQALDGGQLIWLASPPMREELARVLVYPHLSARLAAAGRDAAWALAEADRWMTPTGPAPKAAYTCKDPDDQKFIDLACAHAVPLYSKDKAVLSMARRLARLGVVVQAQYRPDGEAAESATSAAPAASAASVASAAQ